MTGFSYENKTNAYELTIGRDYIGDEAELQKFAEKYWEGPSPILLCLEDGICPDGEDGEYERIKNGLRAWLFMKGVDRFIKQTGTENKKAKDTQTPDSLPDKRWDRDIENIHTLVHIATYQAVENVKIKKV
jgi:hypothetical protein